MVRIQNPGGADDNRYVKSADAELSTSVVYAVADTRGTDVESLEPLTEAIDADALDSLGSVRHHRYRLEFEYAQCLVTVRDGREIRVSPLDNGL